MDSAAAYIAFAGTKLLLKGDLAAVALAARRARDDGQSVLVFDRATGQQAELDLRGDEVAVVARYAISAEPAKRGRPKLGVVAREVTLLPRHWDWLAAQPGGASVVLRRLVEAARKADTGGLRERTEAAYRFMSAMGGDLPEFEEASRALFAGDRAGLEARTKEWPQAIREETLRFLDGEEA